MSNIGFPPTCSHLCHGLVVAHLCINMDVPDVHEWLQDALDDRILDGYQSRRGWPEGVKRNNGTTEQRIPTLYYRKRSSPIRASCQPVLLRFLLDVDHMPLCCPDKLCLKGPVGTDERGHRTLLPSPNAASLCLPGVFSSVRIL